jgi:hypothetical protein
VARDLSGGSFDALGRVSARFLGILLGEFAVGATGERRIGDPWEYV